MKKSHLIIVFLCVAVLLSFCTSGYADDYFVYGGDSFTTTEPDWYRKGYHPELYGYALLGSGSTAQPAKTFSGSYAYYIITVYPVNIADIDTVQGSDEEYFGTNIGGNTIDPQNVGGQPDGRCASVGGRFEGSSGGFIVIDASSHSLASITIYTCISIDDPNADIKANGSDGPVAVTEGTPVSVTISLNPGEYAGFTADWWIAVHTPFAPPANWYTYVHPTGWQTGVNLCAQAELFDLAPFQVLNMALPAGAYTFYFAVDPPDGIPTAELVDSVAVEVTP